MLFNNTGEDAEIIGCAEPKEIHSNSIAVLGNCEKLIILKLTSGKSLKYGNFSSHALENWREFEPFMGFRMTNRSGILRIQVNPNGQAFIASKGVSLPEVSLPKQPVGFPLSAALAP
ncbi:hypothetical protein HXX02_00165 [Microbulbifer elongatus]|uniref:Uncharacterized protein n=1 Tax=Microbulbifer elongatus TaxID=86173 RepID=A0ABT1NYS1_9GAMM|nr:hypothetical protein [Microbulbifer elongatus]MCQ3827849.1 hypothetical protein [Microbulbifer elongatus]